MRIQLGIHVRLAISGSGSNFDVADILLRLLLLPLLHDFSKKGKIERSLSFIMSM